MKNNLIKKLFLLHLKYFTISYRFYGVILFQVILFIILLKFNGEVPA